VRLKTDEVLFVAGDPGDGCYRVLDGLLKVVMTSDSNERILAFLGLGAIVGELSVIDRLPRSASVTAVRPAILSFVSDADFREFGKEHPQVYEALVALPAARLRETDTTIATGTFLPLHGRVACALLELAQKDRPIVANNTKLSFISGSLELQDDRASRNAIRPSSWITAFRSITGFRFALTLSSKCLPVR